MDGTVAIVSRNYICINRRSVSIIFCLARIIKKYAKICTIFGGRINNKLAGITTYTGNVVCYDQPQFSKQN